MSKPIEISEIFMSLEGEGPLNSHPTIYIRFARCNFTCAHFNNETKSVTSAGYAPLDFNPKDYTTLTDIPLVHTGCDSQYAVNPSFSHMWEKLTIDEIAERLKHLLPRGQWVHPDTGLPVILSLTGGEPTLHWKRFGELLNHPFISQCKHVLVETNCSVPIQWKFVMDINQWLFADETRKWTWSNSPKLSDSGEKWGDAIKPDVAAKQRMVMGKTDNQVTQYFKFVIGPREKDFKEIEQAMEEYYSADIPRNIQKWCMPEACTQLQQQSIDKQVAKMCMDKGYLFCYRLQNALWGNGVGT